MMRYTLIALAIGCLIEWTVIAIVIRKWMRWRAAREAISRRLGDG